LRARRDSFAYQDKTVIDIVDSIFGDYKGQGALAPQWRWEVKDRAAYAKRSLTIQYRETDYAFIERLLAEAGLGWTVLEDESVPARHVVQLFADSRNLAEDAESAGGGIRFQRAAATESRDTVQALARQRRRTPDSITVLGWHDSGKRAVAAQAPVNPASGQDDAAGLDWYEIAGHGGFADEA
ncbi:contractile injection system protein, VgrG/Pvc8 family, partial [Piscirickettsia salmonis]|uniref:contractile injection system protein, VgrG/Pvc8 family n=1 Tax=Piscirickettsia salmonis TaxID=1238 RepID=UPI001E460B83